MRVQNKSMRSFLVAAAVAAAAAFSAKPVFATALAYEPFDQGYTSDGYANDASPSLEGLTVGQYGFSGSYSSGSDDGVAPAGLSNPLDPSQGTSIGRVSGNNSAYYAIGQFDTTPGGNFGTNGYLESSGGANTSGYNIGAGGTTLYFSFLFAPQNGSTTETGNFEFLLDGNSGNANKALQINVSSDASTSDADLYVGELVFGANNSDTLYSATDPSSPSALTQVPGTGNYSFDRFQLTGTADGSKTSDLEFDEIRFGTTYGDVVPGSVPEPVGLGLLVVCSFGLLARRRRA
jgi:hypothetical protein